MWAGEVGDKHRRGGSTWNPLSWKNLWVANACRHRRRRLTSKLRVKPEDPAEPIRTAAIVKS
jgi:hypothetical protein